MRPAHLRLCASLWELFVATAAILLLMLTISIIARAWSLIAETVWGWF